MSDLSFGFGQIGQSGFVASGHTGSATQVVSVVSVGSGQIGQSGLFSSGQTGSV